MAEDVVIARFRADLDQVKKEFDEYIASLEKVQKEEKDTQAEIKKSGDVAAVTSKKRTDSLKGTTTELKKVEAASKGAFNQKPLAEFNKGVDNTKENVKGLGGSFGGITQSIKGSLVGIGAGIAAAFSVQAVIQFGKASVDAFIEAEENAERLRFAITQIGNESEATFKTLIAQSEQLAAISIFSDDDIQKAQTALATFGLTGNQIDKLIPKILDLASANKIDLASATDAAIRSFEGQTRGLLTLGVKFDDTGSRIGNYNKFIESTEKLTGATAQATETLAGQLQQTANRADELQEKLGEDLAPAFVKLKVFVFEATQSIVDFIKAGADLNRFNFAKELEKGKTATEEIKKRVDDLTAANIKLGQSQEEASNNAIESISNEINARLKLREQTLKDATFRIAASQEEYDLEKQRAANRVKAVQNEKDAIDVLAQAQKDAEAQAKRILTIEQVRIKSIDELNRALKENQQLSDAISKDNVDLIQKELDARLKASDKAKQQAIKDLEELKKKYGQGGFIVPIDIKVNDIQTPETLDFKPLEVQADVVAGNLLDSFFKANAEIIASSQQLVNELSTLYSQLAENQINSIERAKEAQLTSIDVQLQANEEALDKRRISENEALINEKRLLAEQVRAEQEADKKVREIKRKQAIADKLAALIQITINTAQAISASYAQLGPIAGNPAAILMAALGAAQAAIVIAQPIPYAKGTKAAKGGLSLVGEQGPELMMMPKDSKVVNARSTAKYSRVIDAMQDDKFEDYVFKNYITPELEKQKRNYQESQEKSFAKNISQSMVLQMAQGGKGDFYLERISKQGLPMSNVDQLASAIASKITQDIYRR